MMTRSTARSAACVLTLTVIGTLFAAASVRMAPIPQEVAAAPAGVEIDISTMTSTVDAANLPLLSVRDPI